MMRRYGTHIGVGAIGALFVFGAPLFLLTEHPVAFWLLFVPLGLLFVLLIVLWLKSGGLGIGNFILALMILFIMIVALVIVATPEKCEHEDVIQRYVFARYSSTQDSTIRPYCAKCGQSLALHSYFKGELVDKSYLQAIVEHSDGSEIVAGEYYTVTATVPLGFYEYTSDPAELTCEVVNEDFIVRFHVEFREEFNELVRAVEKGDEITFRGRFYDKGCEFTDCELLNNIKNGENK